MRRALLTGTTLTSCGGCELTATPVEPGVAFTPLVGFEVGDGVTDELGVACGGFGVADGAAAAPTTTLNRGEDGKPEPMDE